MNSKKRERWCWCPVLLVAVVLDGPEWFDDDGELDDVC